MKKKSKHARLKRKNEFRFHRVEVKNKKGTTTIIMHPSYVFLEKGNVYIYVTITHSNHVQGLLVVKLRKNPNPLDKNDSYRVVEIREDRKNRFGRRILGWSMDNLDKEDIFEEYKKR